MLQLHNQLLRERPYGGDSGKVRLVVSVSCQKCSNTLCFTIMYSVTILAVLKVNVSVKCDL